jgi:hypothetical protein
MSNACVADRRQLARQRRLNENPRRWLFEPQEENCMNKSLLTGLVAGAAVATAGGVFAGYKMMSEPEFAQVVAVQPPSASGPVPAAP